MQTVTVKEFNQEDLKTLAEDILREAKQCGATAAEVDLGRSQGFSVTVRCGDVETIEHHRDRSLEIKIYRGHRVGLANTSDFSPHALTETIHKACDIARFTQEDPFASLANKEEMAFGYADIPLAFPWDLDVDHAVSLAKNYEAAGMAKDKRITNSEGASIGTGSSFCVYANSHGFIGSLSSTHHTMSCTLIAEKGHDMQRDYSFTTGRDPKELMPIDLLAAEVAEKVVARLGARQLSTRKAPVIFTPSIARDFWKCFISAIRGGALYRKSSFLVDRLYEKIFPDFIRIYERPHLAKGLGSAPFDNDGVRTRDKDFVTDGQLMNYVLGHYAAQKLKMQTTGNAGGVHNLRISHSDHDLKSLLKSMGTGLLVTELLGQGVNLITGGYSRGAAGFWIENGEIQYPVSEITIAGNLEKMFQDIQAVGNDIDTRSSVHTGSVWLKEMMIAGE